MSFKKYVKSTLTESSLSRLWRHNENYDCGAITAFRKFENCGKGKEISKKENQKRNAALAADLKRKGYGITKIVGSYPEGGKSVTEISYFVVDLKDSGNLEKDLKELGKKYDQDSILFIPKGAIQGKNKAYLIGTNKCDNNWLNYGEKEIFNKGKLGYDSPIYTSKINGRPFIFESIKITEEIFGSSSNAILADKWSKEY